MVDCAIISDVILASALFVFPFESHVTVLQRLITVLLLCCDLIKQALSIQHAT